MIHAPGPLPGRPLAFLKRVFGAGGGTCRGTPLGFKRSSLGLLRRQASLSQSCSSLTSDVSKIPNASVRLHPRRHHHPPPSNGKKSRFGAREQRPVTHAPRPQRLGDPGGAPPPRRRRLPPFQPQACSSPEPQTPPRPPPPPPEALGSPKSGEPSQRGTCAGSKASGGESPLHLPRACVSAGPTWSLATRRIGGGGCARPAAAGPSVRPWGRGRGLGGGGAGRGRRGEEGGRRGREGPGRSGRGPPGAGRHLFRVFPRIIDVPLM